MGISLHLREDGRDEGMRCFNARLTCMFQTCVFCHVLVTPNNISVVKNRKAAEILQTKDRLSCHLLLSIHLGIHFIILLSLISVIYHFSN